MVFTTFDRPALYQMLVDNVDDPSIRYYTRTSNLLPGPNTETLHRGIVPAYGSVDGDPASGQTEDIVSALPYYADQIPPFDITITFANEYGQAAVKELYGVELLNEGSGASMDDVVIEETMTFVARELGPMKAIKINSLDNEPGFELDDGFIDYENLVIKP
jgi:hypothetical protein